MVSLAARLPNARSRIIRQWKSSLKKAGHEKATQGMGGKLKKTNKLTGWKISSPLRIWNVRLAQAATSSSRGTRHGSTIALSRQELKPCSRECAGLAAWGVDVLSLSSLMM